MKSSVILVIFLPLLTQAVSDEDTCSIQAALKTLAGLQPVTIVGTPAPAVDDGESRVFCPDGYFVGGCTANLEGVTRYDGIRLFRTNSCAAYNSNQKSTNLTATALCIPLTYTANNMKSHEVDTGQENVYYTCPEGYVMDGCYLLNFYSQDVQVEVVLGPNRCSWRKIGGDIGIHTIILTYICLESESET